YCSKQCHERRPRPAKQRRERTCVECGRTFWSSRDDARYCSPQCQGKAALDRQARKRAEREAWPKRCPYCGDLMLNPRRVQCGKPECKRQWTNERARKFYARWKAENGQRYNAKFTYEHTCEVCGKTWRSENKNSRFCSTSCTNKIRSYERTCENCGKQWLAQQVTARWCSPECTAQRRSKIALDRKLPAVLDEQPVRGWCWLPERHPARQRITPPRLFVQGNCLRCGRSFCAYNEVGIALYCSTRCQRRDSKDRRRARQHGAYVRPVVRRQVFERDRWICQLCGKPTKRDAVLHHPLAPVLDHIIPLARGGTHEPRNTQCAHFICNSRKGDRAVGEQLLLFG